MTYRIEFSKRAIKQLKTLPLDIKKRIETKIDDLATEPRPNGVKKLKGTDIVLYRIRVGKYRVVYQIRDQRLVVVVLNVDHRSQVYDR